MLRIVGGKYRGKKLFSPLTDDVRPSSDRLRESLFNILYSKLKAFDNLSFLDVFAGTGAMGLEALSRGFSPVGLIDKDTTSVLKNTALFDKEANNLHLIKADVARLPVSKIKYDVIFSDAPYDKGLNELALQNLSQSGFIKDGALCIVETRFNETLALSSNFKIVDERRYGMAKLYFYIFEQTF